MTSRAPSAQPSLSRAPPSTQRRGEEAAAESTSRMAGARGVSSQHERMVVDLTIFHNNKSDLAGSVSLSSLTALIARQGNGHREELTFLARLMASATKLLDVLAGQYATPNYSQSLTELKADLHTVQSENHGLTSRLDTLAIE
ncbi:hypothetical protein C6341_g2414 [Phytophthora cactorum]|nr:hypothetical protein C6341_g2414 [Phytophthora cactorum]